MLFQPMPDKKHLSDMGFYMLHTASYFYPFTLYPYIYTQ